MFSVSTIQYLSFQIMLPKFESCLCHLLPVWSRAGLLLYLCASSLPCIIKRSGTYLTADIK